MGCCLLLKFGDTGGVRGEERTVHLLLVATEASLWTAEHFADDLHVICPLSLGWATASIVCIITVLLCVQQTSLIPRQQLKLHLDAKADSLSGSCSIIMHDAHVLSVQATIPDLHVMVISSNKLTALLENAHGSTISAKFANTR